MAHSKVEQRKAAEAMRKANKRSKQKPATPEVKKSAEPNVYLVLQMKPNVTKSAAYTQLESCKLLRSVAPKFNYHDARQTACMRNEIMLWLPLQTALALAKELDFWTRPVTIAEAANA